MTRRSDALFRLLIADDHPVVREGLRRMIAEQPWLRVVGEATSGDEVLEGAARLRPDVLLLDVSMPGRGFLEVLRDLRQTNPRIRVLVLSMHPEEQYAVRALRAGADGYLTKSHSPEQLIEAIRKVVRGGTYVSASLAEKLAHDLAGRGDGPPHETLSDREYEVLCLLGSGRSVKEAAGVLGVSPKTVSTYRARVLEKMQLSSNADLVRYAAQNGLIR